MTQPDVEHRDRSTPLPAETRRDAGSAAPVPRHKPADPGGYLTAEISASAVRANLGSLRRILPEATRLCAVVKADCYGHGQDLLLPTLAAGADWLAVASPDEALHLRQVGYEGEILMFFSPCALPEAKQLTGLVSELIARGVTLTLTNADEIAPVSRAAAIVGAPARIHVKIDTGMHRSGATTDVATDLIAQIRRDRNLRLEGLYTHLATADEPDTAFAREQMLAFERIAAARGDGCMLHAANSAATLALPETHLDMVRPGLAVYGYQPRDDEDQLRLRPALRLTARLMQVKAVPAGGRCGYGLTYRFQRDSRVGLVPIGYGDGYLRCLSNRSSMRICGRDVPIRGRVSMDQTIVDVTEVPEARVGDEVEIISNDPASAHSVRNLARLAGTIPYEITCLLGRRVHRVLVD